MNKASRDKEEKVRSHKKAVKQRIRLGLAAGALGHVPQAGGAPPSSSAVAAAGSTARGARSSPLLAIAVDGEGSLPGGEVGKDYDTE